MVTTGLKDTAPLFLIGYCLAAIAVSAAVYKYVKRFWIYAAISATIPPAILVAADAIYRGYVDSWTYPAAVIAWFASLGCALVYYFALALYRRSRERQHSA